MSVTMAIVYSGRWIFILVIYFVCLLYDVYFHLSDAEKIMQVSFCGLHSAVVYS